MHDSKPFDKKVFEENLNHVIESYIALLRQRGIGLLALVLLGSWAKNRGNEKSDIDTIVVADRLPKGPLGWMARNRLLSDFPLFLGIESYGYTRQEFLDCIRRLDLRVLDSLCCGKVFFDDGFWNDAVASFRLAKDSFRLDETELSRLLVVI